MPFHYKKSKPYVRSLTHTYRNKKKVIALSLEGEIWKQNGFDYEDTIIIKPNGWGKLSIEKLNI